MTQADSGDRTVALGDDAVAIELEQKFPAWGVWRSDTGLWWAARRSYPTGAERNTSLASYLRATTAMGLVDLLIDQEQSKSP
ncbi:hypothetical protein [Nonomuraea sp. B1E8]|uniref:hypothetical protein n=1 Tax=unclassified Nonomuraea TaxID=2593643 RepID=UPI00325CBD9C